ncbi:hypothetical protein PROVRETT_09978 [Providencia rettgeri DSM 1131]|nr:hypothetical protein PROVRETT_09978 [Providencia rettgeri DSM 1131]
MTPYVLLQSCLFLYCCDRGTGVNQFPLVANAFTESVINLKVR